MFSISVYLDQLKTKLKELIKIVQNIIDRFFIKT